MCCHHASASTLDLSTGMAAEQYSCQVQGHCCLKHAASMTHELGHTKHGAGDV